MDAATLNVAYKKAQTTFSAFSKLRSDWEELQKQSCGEFLVLLSTNTDLVQKHNSITKLQESILRFDAIIDNMKILKEDCLSLYSKDAFL